MDIIWHGKSCFSLKGKQATTIINPYGEKSGLNLPSIKGDIVVITNNQEDNDNIKAVGGEPKVVDWPGEYEIANTVLTTKRVNGGKGMFAILGIDGIRICYLEDVGKELNDELIENIGDVDVLLIPIGGKEIMTAEIAHKIIEKVEPRCVIPMYYSTDGLKDDLEDVESFLKIVGATGTEAIEKLSVQTRGQFNKDKTEYIVLTPKL